MPEVLPDAPTDLASELAVSAPADAPAEAPSAAAGSPGALHPLDHLRRVCEASLVRKLRRGDERAFAQLVRDHQDRVYDLLYRMLGDREEALDLSQEVFVAVHANLSRFRGESQLSTWIFRVAKNHCLNRLKYLRRRERGRSEEISEVCEGAIEAQIPSDRPDDALQRREREELAQRAIGELDEEHRLLVVLRDIEGLSYHEIAAITEQPEGTVKSRLHRARATLAEIVVRLERRPR